MAAARAATAIVDDAAIAELRAFNAGFEQRLAATPPVESVPVSESRAAAREPTPRRAWTRRQRHDPAPGLSAPGTRTLPRAHELLIPGRAGQIRLRVLAPEEVASGIYLHLRGGGWVLGERDLQVPLLWELAQATSLCVVSVGGGTEPSRCTSDRTSPADTQRTAIHSTPSASPARKSE
jgi:acetyl esterase